MSKTKIRALTLKTVRFGERSQVVHGLSEFHGKIAVSARNSIQSRRFGGALQPLQLSEWEVTPHENQELWTLHGAQCIHDFSKLARNLETYGIAFFFLECVYKVTPFQQECQELFKLLVNSLLALEESPSVAPAHSSHDTMAHRWIALFVLKLLQWSGYQPKLDACGTCGVSLTDALSHPTHPTAFLFSVPQSCWFCTDCGPISNFNHGTSLSLEAFRWVYDVLRHSVRAASQIPFPLEWNGLWYLISSYAAYHVPSLEFSSLKSFAFFKESLPSSVELNGFNQTPMAVP